MRVRNLYQIEPSCEEQMFRRFSERPGQIKLLVKLFDVGNNWVVGTDYISLNFGEPVERWSITCLSSGGLDPQLNTTLNMLRDVYGINVEVESPSLRVEADETIFQQEYLAEPMEHTERDDNFDALQSQVRAIEAERARNTTALGRAFSGVVSSPDVSPEAVEPNQVSGIEPASATYSHTLPSSVLNASRAASNFGRVIGRAFLPPQSSTTPSYNTTETRSTPDNTEPKEPLTRFDVMDIEDGKDVILGENGDD
tara:strand:- start:4488 stop:5249 length:762 start_codon:yes stop_codon:yes gene_type:complete